MRKIIRQFIPLLLLALLVTGDSVEAGGPLNASGNTPAIYQPNRFPLVYLTDRGTLGAFSNAEAVNLANFAFNEWQTLSTSSVSFSYSGNLDRDVTSATDALISGPTQFNDGIFPVIFDADGSITDARIGSGASNQVYGFATSFTPDGLSYAEGLVVINGRLTTRPDVVPIFREVVTHEIGHMLGVDHSQIGVGADFSLMYPTVLTNINNIGFDPDDVAAISTLYPAPNYLTSVGSISGTLTTSDGRPMSGVNIVAINAATGDAYCTISDYFGGDAPRYRNKPGKSGAYRISGLPPGDYYVKIEPIKSLFVLGSSIASYDPPINTDIYREWYNGGSESGNILVDNGNEKSAVTVTAGNETSGIDIAANDSPTVSEMTEYNGSPALTISLPMQFSNAMLTKLATGYTAPVNGSILGVRFWVSDESSLPSTGNLVVTLYTDKNESLAGIPDNVLGSVTVPLNHLSADQENEVWLRELGGSANFLAGEKFHIGFEITGDGSIITLFDDAVGTNNRGSYFIQENQTWQNFPAGLTGAEGWNMRSSAIYTTVSAGVPTPLISTDPDEIIFGRNKVGEQVTREVEVRNIGTAPLSTTQTLISGAGASVFEIVSGGGAFTLAPGETRDLVVGFNPSASSNFQATLSIFHNADGSPTTINLAGVGKNASLASVATLLDFGTVTTSEQVSKDFTVFQNGGSDSLRVLGSSVDAPDGGLSLVSSSGPAFIPPGGSYRVRLRFRPTEEKTYNGTLSVRHELDTDPLDVPITGTWDDGQVGGVGSTLAAGGVRLSLEGITPNPIVDRGTLLLSGSGTGSLGAEIMVVDLSGRLLQSNQTTLTLHSTTKQIALPLNLKNLPSGVYALILKTDVGSVVRRVVVRR